MTDDNKQHDLDKAIENAPESLKGYIADLRKESKSAKAAKEEVETLKARVSELEQAVAPKPNGVRSLDKPGYRKAKDEVLHGLRRSKRPAVDAPELNPTPIEMPKVEGELRTMSRQAYNSTKAAFMAALRKGERR